LTWCRIKIVDKNEFEYNIRQLRVISYSSSRFEAGRLASLEAQKFFELPASQPPGFSAIIGLRLAGLQAWRLNIL
jgi:hypothetical protein